MRKIICFIGMVLCTLMLFSCKDKGFEEVKLSNKLKEQVALDYADYHLIEIYEGNPNGKLDSGHFSCLGKFKNVYFISYLDIDFGVYVYDEFSTENSYVRIYSTHPFYAYLNHKFYDVEELYKLGKVSEEALLDLSDYTKEHFLPAEMDIWKYSYTDKELILQGHSFDQKS